MIWITVQATINSSLEQVWKCWTTPADIMQWNNASDDWHTPNATVDLRVGGQFTSRMEARDGSFGFDFSGTYTVVEPQARLEYVLEDDRKVSITFAQDGDLVTVTEAFQAESENAAELQKAGWQAILDNFKRHVERR